MTSVPVAVRPAAADDAAACQAIVLMSPDYFTDDVPAKVEEQLRLDDSWVAVDGDGVVGFAIVERRAELAAEVLWLAVDKACRRRGIGTALLTTVLDALARDGVRFVEAKTLDASAGYEPYIATRAFWERRGFVQIDTIDPLPDWQPGNPAAIYVGSVCAIRP